MAKQTFKIWVSSDYCVTSIIMTTAIVTGMPSDFVTFEFKYCKCQSLEVQFTAIPVFDHAEIGSRKLPVPIKVRLCIEGKIVHA